MLRPRTTLSRSYIGLGAFLGSAISSGLGGGPFGLLGYVPSRHWSFLHIEFEGAWTSQSSESMRIDTIPLVGSLCFVREFVRFCGGLATTLFILNSLSIQDELHLKLGGNVRVGTELFVHGPFSLRADVFGRLAWPGRTFGASAMAIGGPTPFAAGLAVLGGWAFE